MNRLFRALTLVGGIAFSSLSVNAQDKGGLERIAFDEEIVESLRKNDPTWVIYGEDAEKTEFYIFREGEKQGTLCIKNGKEFFRKEARSEIIESIRRLYNFNGENISYEFNENLKLEDVGKIREWNLQIADICWKQPDDVVEKAISSLSSAGKNSVEFLKAIELLSRCQYSKEAVGSAIWYLANIEGIKNEPENEPFIWYSTNERGMGLRRLDEKTREIIRISDLQVMDARTFYENIFYAVKARDEMPWGKNISTQDFLTYVLAARTTQEPISRFRRHFYESLSSVMKKMGSPEEALMFINEMVHAL